MLKHNPDLRIYGLAKIGEKGQVVIPALARKELGLRPNDEIIMVGSPSKKILGCMHEEDFRELLGCARRRFEAGLEMSQNIAKVSDQLNDMKNNS